MLVSATEMLKKAKAGHYAVGQFNINNLEWTKAILQTAQECNSPVILGVSEGAGKYMTGYKTVVGMVNGMLEELNITVPVALHLDHGSYEGCLKCVEAGFSSIMFDGSHYPIEENVAKTTELVKIVKEHGMSLEAEVGSIGGEEDGVIGAGECADPKECKMIADLGVDFLAAGIGNIHGKYPANWKGLSFETLAAVQELTGELAAEILVGESSALYQRLYEQNIIDSDFSADYEYMRGMCLLEASGDSDEPERVLDELLREAARIAREGVDEVQLRRLKKSMLGRRTRALDSFESTCYRMSAYYFEGIEYLEYPALFRRVGAEDVQRFLRENIIPERAAISIIYPKEEA